MAVDKSKLFVFRVVMIALKVAWIQQIFRIYGSFTNPMHYLSYLCIFYNLIYFTLGAFVLWSPFKKLQPILTKWTAITMTTDIQVLWVYWVFVHPRVVTGSNVSPEHFAMSVYGHILHIVLPSLDMLLSKSVIHHQDITWSMAAQMLYCIYATQVFYEKGKFPYDAVHEIVVINKRIDHVRYLAVFVFLTSLSGLFHYKLALLTAPRKKSAEEQVSYKIIQLA